MKKKKLALIGHTYGLAHNRWKAHALSEYYDVYCIIPRLSGKDPLGQNYDTVDQDFEPSDQYEVIYLKELNLRGEITTFILSGLGKELKRIDPEVILIENEPWSFLRWQVWAHSLFHPKALLAEFTWENIKRPSVKGVILDFVYRLTARTSGVIVAGNEQAKELLVEAGKSKDKILVAAQLGVPDENFPKVSSSEKNDWKRNNGFKEQDIVIGFCGRFIEEKGILELLEAMKVLNKKNDVYRLVLLGDGPLKETVSEELNGAGIIVPPVKHYEVPDYMKYWDLAILPSKRSMRGAQLWEEQFGRVIIEAVAAGVPCIGSSSGAIPEVLGFESAVFKEGDADAIVSKLEELASAEVREKLYQLQSTRVSEIYTHSSIAQQYYSFFESFSKKTKS